ncbi:MAG TPA: hypothetical protein PLU82_04235, partial [Oscillospiraceae bacterium]|nr:hypothetical protein [Oscillospiraceae bacterium]
MKKLLGILLAALLLLGLLPVTALAATTSTYSVRDSTELENAIAGITSVGTITLEADITACIEIPVGKTITLDLDDY